MQCLCSEGRERGIGSYLAAKRDREKEIRRVPDAREKKEKNSTKRTSRKRKKSHICDISEKRRNKNRKNYIDKTTMTHTVNNGSQSIFFLCSSNVVDATTSTSSPSLTIAHQAHFWKASSHHPATHSHWHSSQQVSFDATMQHPQ